MLFTRGTQGQLDHVAAQMAERQERVWTGNVIVVLYMRAQVVDAVDFLFIYAPFVASLLFSAC